jgi:nitrate/nitrite-specific signal transduction histidine kinase
MYRNRRSNSSEVLESRISQKQKELEQLNAELQMLEDAVWQLSDDDADVVVKRHIKQLKIYNELKDTALSLMTLIADQRQIRLGDVMKEIGVEADES